MSKKQKARVWIPNLKTWEKELRDVYDTAASFDDRSDFDCMLPFMRDVVAKAKEEGIREVVEEIRDGVIKMDNRMHNGYFVIREVDFRDLLTKLTHLKTK